MSVSLIESLVRDAERAEAALSAPHEHAAGEPCEHPPAPRRARKAAPAAAPVGEAAPKAERGVLSTIADQRRYVLAGYVDAAGHAHGGRLTIVSRVSGARYTYRVQPPSGGKAGAPCRKCDGTGMWRGARGGRGACFTCTGTGTSGGGTVASGESPERLFVAVLTGSDNTRDYTYLGSIIARPHARYEHGARATIGPDAPSAKAAEWYLSRLLGGGCDEAILRQCEVWHESTCGRCGHDLTAPESIARGIGPDCWEKMGF